MVPGRARYAGRASLGCAPGNSKSSSRAAATAVIRQGGQTRRGGNSFRAPRGSGRCRGAEYFHSKEILALTGSYFTFGYVAWIFFSWFYIYLVQVRGLNLKTSAVYSMFPFIAMTLGSHLPAEWPATGSRDHVSLREPAAAFCRPSPWPARRFCSPSGRERAMLRPPLSFSPAERRLCICPRAASGRSPPISRGHTPAVVSGTMNTGCQMGGAVTASLTPMIAAHFGWGASFLTATRACRSGRNRLARRQIPRRGSTACGNSAPRVDLHRYRTNHSLQEPTL
jgi:ACS family glucarate transporter-like MFS transporter